MCLQKGRQVDDMRSERKPVKSPSLSSKVRVAPVSRKEPDVEKLARALVAVAEKTAKRQAA